MMKAQSPTLNDVAMQAGVSTATVSRCLNEPEKVTAKTREKVMATVTALGYSPNFGARAMATQRTNTIGAVIPTMENAIFARGLQAFQEELWRLGFNLMVASSSYQRELEVAQVRSLVARGADALLLIGHIRDPQIYALLDAQQIPSLVTWTYDPSAARPSVGFDNCAAMRDMARKVLELGHQRLAMMTAPLARNDRAQARLLGLKDAMVEFGLNSDALPIVEYPYGIENGAIGFAALMQGSTKPTAIFCGNDVLAVGALRGARDMGLNVPGDVSIIGFDDIELSQVTYPLLTTVHVPHRDMGQRAARALVRHLNDDAPLESQELHTELRLRASLGPPPR
ncbi:LacI family DNA-binding transcriptional regulator [Cognatiyoonia sp. IB215182]|nr:LacI family DNA-binding transcriptional regulator [Cognatiyoonia sp. IB215182]MDX8352927.1 LacI family DNA-binding transcriptional regulator [Cognatiyoonia sp. IB215182]